MNQVARKARMGKPVKVAGTSPDGVVILMPSVRPTHFTYAQIKKTIDSLRRDASGETADGGRDSATQSAPQ